MTADTTANSNAQLNSGFAALKRAFLGGLNVVLGAMVVIAAGILAVAVAIVGLILAGSAIAYRMISRASASETTPAPMDDAEDGLTLDAHRTANGWTVT